VLVVLALVVPLLRGIAVPQRTVTAIGADAATLNMNPAPDFTLEAADGRQVSLSDFKGQVVLLNLWATWCPPCVRETPRLVRVYDKYRDQGFVILAINTTYQDDRAKVAQFVRDQRVSYLVLLDVNGEFGQKYGARLLPTSYLVDRSGKIVMTKVGEVDEAQLEEQVQALLKAGRGAP
jgi:cytochrome c biogenesis protein CcmG/thiol:disulfide interchange protein DsbE